MEDGSVAAGMTTIEELPNDALTQVLRRLNGPSLAAASCTTTQLHSLSFESDIWRDLCLKTWPSLRLLPSFPGSHRAFFSDAYSFPIPTTDVDVDDADLPARLISAVDLYYKGVHIHSWVLQIRASTYRLRRQRFIIKVPHRDDPLKLKPEPLPPPFSPEELTLSWVVIDPDRHRSVNVSSRRPASVVRHWYSRETRVWFATVVEGGGVVEAVVTCGEAGHVKDITLTADDVDGYYLQAREGLVVLKRLMEAPRRVRDGEDEDERLRRYDKHVRRRRWRILRWNLINCLGLFCS